MDAKQTGWWEVIPSRHTASCRAFALIPALLNRRDSFQYPLEGYAERNGTEKRHALTSAVRCACERRLRSVILDRTVRQHRYESRQHCHFHSASTLSAHSINWTRIAVLAKEAFFPAKSESKTPRALEHAPQTWIGIPRLIVTLSVSAKGGQPTGTTAFAIGSRIKPTASPRRKICTSWPASASALACKNGKAAFVGSSEPHALLTRTLLMFASLS